MKHLITFIGLTALAPAGAGGASALIQDKTLVVWAAPANLTQRASSALTIDDGQAHFDGIVFAELAPRKWMAGSDGFSRTHKAQQDWPEETADATTFVQIAVVYYGREVTLYRNGQKYASYTMPDPPRQFGPSALVLSGRRHLEASDKDNSYTGRIKDARIYAQPLERQTIAALQPGRVADDPKPWAWWSFGDEGLREKTGRFTEIRLIGDVRIEEGCLVLVGQGASVITTAPGDDDGKQITLPKAWSFNRPVPDEVVRSTRLLRERFLADPIDRPIISACRKTWACQVIRMARFTPTVVIT